MERVVLADIIEVKLWGVTIGRMGYADDSDAAVFEYEDQILNSGIEISPLMMSSTVKSHQFMDISANTFKGLSGVFADSLPDAFGTSVIDVYLAQQGVDIKNVTALDRLLYIRDRGMGALEYHLPESGRDNNRDNLVLDVSSLAEVANSITKSKRSPDSKLFDVDGSVLNRFLRMGSSAGGARAKALVATSPDGDFLDGTLNHGVDHDYWVIKFDSDSNKDRDGFDPKGMTKIEYLYTEIASQIGIDTPRTSYFEENGNFHFLIERFDRLKVKGKLEKLHYASWSGLSHAHRDTTGVYSYEQLVMVCRKMNMPQRTIEQLFRRAVFNVIGRNQDDHCKNHGFCMSKSGEWFLSKAFDLTYSYDPGGRWTRTHQIALNGELDGFSLEDLMVFGEYCNVSRIKAKEIVQQTLDAFSGIGQKMACLDVPKDLASTVVKNLRMLRVK